MAQTFDLKHKTPKLLEYIDESTCKLGLGKEFLAMTIKKYNSFKIELINWTSPKGKNFCSMKEIGRRAKVKLDQKKKLQNELDKEPVYKIYTELSTLNNKKMNNLVKLSKRYEETFHQ